ncbi:hypothetical protein [Anaerobacillus alkalilacustris]|nr:hypothetical protein [Anaerobacillus alkalilacustris]
MSRKRKRQPKWHLLFRIEENQKVYLYEPLQKHELNSRLRNGWKVVS